MVSIKTFKGMGRGLVASSNIPKGKVIFTVEVIELNRQDTLTVEKTILNNYVYCLGNGRTGVALGLGSLFNHHDDNNIDFTVKKIRGRYMIQYKTLKSIKKGQQLFLNYGWKPE